MTVLFDSGVVYAHADIDSTRYEAAMGFDTVPAEHNP